MDHAITATAAHADWGLATRSDLNHELEASKRCRIYTARYKTQRAMPCSALEDLQLDKGTAILRSLVPSPSEKPLKSFRSAMSGRRPVDLPGSRSGRTTRLHVCHRCCRCFCCAGLLRPVRWWEFMHFLSFVSRPLPWPWPQGSALCLWPHVESSGDVDGLLPGALWSAALPGSMATGRGLQKGCETVGRSASRAFSASSASWS